MVSRPGPPTGGGVRGRLRPGSARCRWWRSPRSTRSPVDAPCRAGASRAIPSGTSLTTWSERTTQMWSIRQQREGSASLPRPNGPARWCRSRPWRRAQVDDHGVDHVELSVGQRRLVGVQDHARGDSARRSTPPGTPAGTTTLVAPEVLAVRRRPAPGPPPAGCTGSPSPCSPRPSRRSQPARPRWPGAARRSTRRARRPPGRVSVTSFVASRTRRSTSSRAFTSRLPSLGSCFHHWRKVWVGGASVSRASSHRACERDGHRAQPLALEHPPGEPGRHLDGLEVLAVGHHPSGALHDGLLAGGMLRRSCTRPPCDAGARGCR